MINHIIFLTRTYLGKQGILPEKAQGLVEYAIILLLVALVVIGGLRLFGIELLNIYDVIIEELPFD